MARHISTLPAAPSPALSHGRVRLLLVGHDAFPSGAQQLLLNIGKTLKSALGLDIHFVLLDGGELEESYRAVAPVTVLKTLSNPKALLAGLVTGGFTAAVVNTCAAAPLALTLRALGARSVLLVHELPRLLREKALEDAAREGLMHADTVVFPSRFVKDRLLEALGSPPVRDAIILPQGLYKMLQPNARAAARVRKELGIAADEPLVLGVGYADIRKGFDLFLQIWRLCQQNEARSAFLLDRRHGPRAEALVRRGDAKGRRRQERFICPVIRPTWKAITRRRTLSL